VDLCDEILGLIFAGIDRQMCYHEKKVHLMNPSLLDMLRKNNQKCSIFSKTRKWSKP